MHTQLRHFLFVEHTYRDGFEFAAQCAGFVGKVIWCTDVAGQIAEVSRDVDTFTNAEAGVNRAPIGIGIGSL